MDAAENPFAPGAGSTPPALVGRNALLERVPISLQRVKKGSHERSLLLSGLRGVGKTVLLRALANYARDHEFAIVSIEATDDDDFMRTLALKLRRILIEWKGESSLLERARAALSSFTLTIDPNLCLTLGIQRTTQGIADTGLLEVDVPDVFSMIGLAAKEHGSGVFLAIDEVQYLRPADLKAIIMAIHRAAQEQLPVFLVGAGLPQLYANVGNAKSYAERLFVFESIGALTASDVALAVETPAAQLGVTFTADALAAIYTATSGYPYFVQEWAYDLWNFASSSPIDRDTVIAISETVHQRLDATFFRVRFDRLTPREKQYLRALAELGPGTHRSGDVAAILGKRSNAFGPVRDILVHKGMIYSPEWGVTGFTGPLFDDFMKREMNLAPLSPRSQKKERVAKFQASPPRKELL